MPTEYEPIKAGTLVEVKVPAVFRGVKYGWVVGPCFRDGGTVVYVPDLPPAFHDVCVKETDFIMVVKKNVSG